MTITNSIDYITSRAANHGISYDDAVSKCPSAIQGDPVSMAEFISNKDFSHIQAVSLRPDLQSEPSNWFFEDPFENQARRATTATAAEINAAELDNASDLFDGDWDDDGLLDATEFVADLAGTVSDSALEVYDIIQDAISIILN